MKRVSLRISKEASIPLLLFFVLMLPHFKPVSVDEIDSLEMLDVILNALRVGSALFIFFICLIKYKRFVGESLLATASLLCLQFFLLVSTIGNDNSLVLFAKTNLMQTAVFLLIYLACDNWKGLLKFFLSIGEILVYSNLVAIILKPDGLYLSKTLNYYHNWILGFKNMFFPYFLCFTVVALLYNHYNKFSIRPYILVVAMLISLFLARSVSPLLVLSLLVLLAIVARNRVLNFTNPLVLLVINITLFLIVIVFRNYSFLLDFVAGYFSKDVTLTGRTFIWDGVYRAVERKPFFGYGMISSQDSLWIIGAHDGVNAHNIILQFLYNGGVTGLILWFVFNVFLVKKLNDYKKSYSARVLSIAFFVFNIASLTESYFADGYQGPLIFAVFAFIESIDKYIQSENEIPQHRVRFVLRIPSH